MKFTLNDIEQGVRAQFVWMHDPKTRWSVNPEFTNGVKGLGAIVFIGLATQLGFNLQDIKDYMDLEELDVDEKLKSFNTRMNEMIERKLTGVNLKRGDVTGQLFLKTQLALSWIRFHCLREYVPTYLLNH